MNFRRERFAATFLDPRQAFAAVETPLEVRWDPLTGASCRLLPAGSVPSPERHDLQALAEQTRPTCPFCSERLETETPRFPSQIAAAGRIRRGEAVLFPNLVPYAKWSSVSVYSPGRHCIPIEELTPQLLADNLATQVEFARAATAHDRSSSWISINANHLPPSGSSIFHPHLQGSASPVASTMQRLLADAPLKEYVSAERDGERHIATGASVEWIASFAPIGPAEIRGFVSDAPLVTEFDDETVEEVADGISRILRVYAELGYESFNLALSGSLVRLVARAYYGSLARSDAMWSERLHWEAATDLAPERVAALARMRFA